MGAQPTAVGPALSPGFPNPSRGPVEFALDLPAEAAVEWTVYDLQGRVVRSEGRALSAGRSLLSWDGTTASGEPAATGVYLVRARVAGMQFTRRVIRF
jgi:flagellar hook assembly protein FlgD